MVDSNARGIDRRRLLGWGGLAAAGVVGGVAVLEGAPPGHADPDGDRGIPPDLRPGGAYDRYLAELAAAGRFSGVVVLSHRGRTVLSRAFGMADEERGIPNHEGTAFTLSSAGKPFGAVAVLQLVQEGRLNLWDTVGAHLTGFAPEIAERVTVHHLLSGTSGLSDPDEEPQRVFHSREEVREYNADFARRAKVVAPPGTPTDHVGAEVAIPAMIVEAVTGRPYWDHVQENVFDRAGMTGTGFYTRPRWLTDEHIAHPYMELADGSHVDAVRNLDKGSPFPWMLGKNPGRAFIDAPGDGGFATASDLVRLLHGLGDGTVLDGPHADLLTGAKIPHGGGGGLRTGSADASFGAYGMPVRIVNGQWVFDRAGANPGVAAGWSIHPATGWVGVILCNRDGAPLREMAERQEQAILGPR